MLRAVPIRGNVGLLHAAGAVSARTARQLGERGYEALRAVISAAGVPWGVSAGVARRAPRPGDTSSSSRFLCLSRARAALRAPIIASQMMDTDR